MAVSYRSSSTSGASDVYVSMLNVPVPSGAATNDIALVALEMWEVGNPTVTPPAGFALLTEVLTGQVKLKVFWKRLTGADSGNYTFSWSGTQWSQGHAMLVSGARPTGNPVSIFNSATGTSATTPTTSVTTAFQPFLAHFASSENGTTQTAPPTGFTNAQNGNVLRTNYAIPGTTGTHTASGGTLAISTRQAVALVAVEPESRWQRGDGTPLRPYLFDGSNLIELN